MNVRIVPRDAPQRTVLFGGVRRVESDDQWLFLVGLDPRWGVAKLTLKEVAEILLDDETGCA